jgi:hypothetical protein
MKLTKIWVFFFLVAFNTNVSAYGSSSSSKKACKKPEFTKFTPVHLSEVAPESEFSFVASALTNPESIVVTIKKQPVDVIVNKLNSGYSVSGKLPGGLEGTYARVDINATGTKKCKSNDGWLLKIEGKAP